MYTVGLLRKQHALADEGSYFIAHNNQTLATMLTKIGGTTGR